MKTKEAVAVWRRKIRGGGRGGSRIPEAAVGAVWRGYQAGMNAKEIADALGVTYGQVQNALRSYGISGEGRPGRPRQNRKLPSVNLLDDYPFSLSDITAE